MLHIYAIKTVASKIKLTFCLLFKPCLHLVLLEYGYRQINIQKIASTHPIYFKVSVLQCNYTFKYQVIILKGILHFSLRVKQLSFNHF